jgi:hypothetical protein
MKLCTGTLPVRQYPYADMQGQMTGRHTKHEGLRNWPIEAETFCQGAIKV